MEPVLRAEFSAWYGSKQVLRDIRLELFPGETLGLAGTSGAGKSTLVLALLGLLPQRGGRVSGEVMLQGHNLLTMPAREARKLRGSSIALIPQSPLTSLNAALSLSTHFSAAWRAHQPNGSGLCERVRELMGQVQLPASDEFLARRPGQISIGQAQRVLIALALLHRPAVLLADEPTSALDPLTQGEIIRLLQSVEQTTRPAMLYISHDLVSLFQLSQRLAVLDGGTIVECVPVGSLPGAAQHACTRKLLDALPLPVEVLIERRR